IERRKLGFEVAVGARRLDVITTRSGHVTTARESELVLVKRHDRFAILGVDADVLQMRRQAMRIQELATSKRLFRPRDVLNEVQRRFVGTDDAKDGITVKAADDRSRVQSSGGIQIMKPV